MKKTFNKKTLTNAIIGVFSNSPQKSFNYKQIAKQINVQDLKTRQMIIKILDDLERTGHLEQLSKGKYKFASRAGYITGEVDLSSKGYGYVNSKEMTEPVFVSQNNLHHALHRDKVKVYLFARKRRSELEGEVVEIIGREKNTFVGTLEVSNSFAFLIPDTRKMPYDIFIPLDKLKGARDGQKVIAKVIEWPRKKKNPIGAVLEVLGNAGEHEAELHAIMAEFELPYRFPENVSKSAEQIETAISEEEIKQRRDFRRTVTFTIDPEDAKDFDDALSLRKMKNGNWEIGVHIADVTHYVQPNTILDKEALNRATSVYLVDRVVPMLPENLSNEVCSLRPNEDKLCFSAVFEINDNAVIQNQWFGRTVINSDRRFTYQEAQEIIEGKKDKLSDEIIRLNKLAQKLRNKRFKEGSISFERTEVKFKLDESGKPLNIVFRDVRESNQLIEEFMLLANKRVAEFIGKQKDKKPVKTFVYRIHDLPDPDKLSSFAQFVKKFGYKLQVTSRKEINTSLNALLQDSKGTNEQNIIEELAVRAMAKAVYSTENIGHYGLSFPYYTHFTSPIRRYPDIMVHRLLDHYLQKGSSRDPKPLEKKCRHSSDMEQRAVNAERTSIKYKQVEFMSDKIGKVFEGIISGVTDWGLFVEVIENKCEGLVSIRDINDDFYIFEGHNYCLRGQSFGKKYQLGDKVNVRITKTNLVKKQMDMELVEE